MKKLNQTPPDMILRQLQSLLEGSQFRYSSRGLPVVHHKDHRISWFGRTGTYRVFHGHRDDPAGQEMKDFESAADVVAFFAALHDLHTPADVFCPYCHSRALLRPSTYVYGEGKDYGDLYVCTNYPSCDAYVGVQAGTMQPKGTLANGPLRELRKRAHAIFDPLWEDKGKYARVVAHKAAATVLGLDQFHIAWSDEQTCQNLIDNIGEVKTLVDNDTSHPLHHVRFPSPSQEVKR